MRLIHQTILFITMGSPRPRTPYFRKIKSHLPHPIIFILILSVLFQIGAFLGSLFKSRNWMAKSCSNLNAI